MLDLIFHREALADMQAKSIISGRGASGVFLSAPRRTGKSTFIREDLVPKLTSLGVEVIYVDLWADRAEDPGNMIADAVGNHLRKNESKLVQWAKNSGINKLSMAGVQVDFGKVGIGAKETFSSGLAALSDATKSLIVLVIDEAQQAITSGKGSDALFALKAARDELNSSLHHGFRLVATGSNRDKLSMLVNVKDQAFYGAPLVTLPFLDDEFLKWEQLKFDGAVTPSINAMRESFISCGYRPEFLIQCLDVLAFQPDLDQANVDGRLLDEMQRKMGDSKKDFVRLLNSLPPMQAAVIRVMAEDNELYAPFKTETVKRYKLLSELTGGDANVDISSIQYALDALRDKSLVWKSSRGIYSIEDSQHIAWLNEEYQERNK